MTDMNSADDFFDTYAPEGGGGAPSFHFGNLGDTVKGKIVSLRQMDQTYFGTKTPIPDPKRPGQNKKQLQVILETPLRNWEGCKNNQSSDQDGNLRPPSEDTGARAIYIKGWMIGAVADAVAKATDGKERAPRVGGMLAVQFSEAEPTNKGNDLKKYAANYKAPAVGAELFEDAEEEKTTNAVAAANAPSMSLDDDEDDIEVPF